MIQGDHRRRLAAVVCNDRRKGGEEADGITAFSGIVEKRGGEDVITRFAEGLRLVCMTCATGTVFA
jgi:hypothetical protein